MLVYKNRRINNKMFVPLSQLGSRACEQGSEEWFKKRKHKMTGSKPSSIMFDCVDEASYHKLWSIIFGEQKQEPFNERQTLAVNWGKDMEDVAAKQFYETLPGTVVYETSIIDNPAYDWMAASPDGYIVRLDTDEHGQVKRPLKVVERANFEIKCPASHLRDADGNPMPRAMAKELQKKKNPPYYYLTQLHFEMVALGTPNTYFYMWTPWYSKVWKVFFDHAYWEETVALLDAFRRKEVPWNVLESKIKTWKNTSQAICRKYKPIYEWTHAPEGAFDEPVVPKLPPQPIKVNPWYSDEEKQYLKSLFPQLC